MGHANVIVGGDLNWTSEVEGEMGKLVGKPWVDCFRKVKPDEDGYTYDTQSNGMLAGQGRVQERVDRVLYKEKGNLRLVSCEMIGREAIPNESFVRVVHREDGKEEL